VAERPCGGATRRPEKKKSLALAPLNPNNLQPVPPPSAVAGTVCLTLFPLTDAVVDSQLVRPLIPYFVYSPSPTVQL
jgi:hypothetical protein